MLITKRMAKQTCKKLLSTFLAVIMLMTSMSVCFGTFAPTITASAVDTATAVSDFVAAATAYCSVTSFKDAASTAESTNGKTGANLEKTKTWTFKTASYTEYQLLKDVIKKLDTLVKSLDEYTVTHTHNNGAICADGWYAGSTQTNKCSDWGYVKDALINSLGASYATLKSKDIDKLLDAVLNYDLVPQGINPDGALIRPTNGQTTDYGDSSTEDGAPKKLFNVVVIEAPDTAALEVVSAANSIAAIPDEINTSVKYTLGLSRQNYQTESKDSCGNVSYTNHYHMAINTKETGEPKVEENGSESTNKSVLTAAETAFGTTYAAYFASKNKNDVLAVSSDADKLAEDLAAIKKAKKDVVDTFGSEVYQKFFKNYAYDTAVKNIEDAITFLGFAAVIENINNLCAVSFDGMSKTELAAHLAAVKEAYSEYTKLDEATQAELLEIYTDFSPADVEATIAAITKAYELAVIAEKKAAIDEHLAAYENKWTIEDVDADRLVYDTAWAAYLIVEQDYTELKAIDKATLVEACGEGYFERVEALYNHLAFLSAAANYNDAYTAAYKEFYATIQGKVPTTDSEPLLSTLKNYDGWYADLRELIADMEANLEADVAELLFDEVNKAMLDYMDSAYAVLNARIETQIDVAYDLYKVHEKVYGPTVHFVSLESYQIVSESIGLIDKAAYDFLEASPNFTLADATVEKYEALKNLLVKFDEFSKDRGFETFYELRMADYEREDTIDDQFRQNSDKDEDGKGEFITSEAQIEKVIKVIDTALTNASVSGALGFDLGTMLSDLVEDAVLSDSLINTVVEMLYPLVLKEFGKVFANDLPTKEGDNDVIYQKGLHTTLKDAGFEIYPDLLAAKLEKTKNNDAYKDTVTALKAAYTDYKNLHKNVGAQGDDAYTTELDPAGGTNSKGEARVIISTTPWDSTEIRGEDGKLNLTWGIDAAKANGVEGDALKALFYETFDDAMEGLKPLLLAIVANKEWKAPTVETLAKAGPSGMQVATVDLNLGATANSGYANLIVPLFEALGIFDYTDVSKIEGEFLNDTTKDVELIVEAIFDPIFAFVDKLGDAPLDTVLGILPNLCYTLSAGMLKPLLGMLKTKIWYLAPITIPSWAQGCGVATPAPPEGQVDIDVGEMLKIEALDNIYAEGINGVISLLGIEGLPRINQELVACLGELTIIESQRKDAVYSSLDRIDGYEDGDLNRPILAFDGRAYHIEANKAAVLSYIAEYLLTAIGQEGVLDAILGLFNKEEEPAEGEDTEAPAEGEDTEAPAEGEDTEAPAEGEETETPAEGETTAPALDPLVLEIIENVSTNPTATIAAIVELFNFSEYETKMLYNWFDGENYQATTVTGFTPAAEIYASADNDWNREKAEWLYDNLDEIIVAVMAMINTDGEAAESLDVLLSGLVADLYSDETLTALARLLGQLDLNALVSGEEAETETETEDDETATVAEDDENTDADADTDADAAAFDLNALVRDLLGIDLSSFAENYGDIPSADENPEYVYPFGVTDAESFVNKLVEMLTPLGPVLDFLLTGGELSVFDGEAEVVLYGSNGYDMAIIPLLEALGCTPAAAATGLEALEATLNALTAKIAEIQAAPVDGIFGLLPGFIYFLTSNGLSTAIQNLLKPVLVVLETIRPIYNVDIETIVSDLLAKNNIPAIDLSFLDANYIIDVICAVTGLNLSALKTIFYDAATLFTIKEYKSASTLQATFKTAEYGNLVDEVDMLTVILSFFLEWATVPENGEKLDELLKTNGIVSKLNVLFKESVLEPYGTPDWYYWFNNDADAFNKYIESGEGLPNTLEMLTYPNKWTEETAVYVAKNLTNIADDVIAALGVENAESVAQLLDNLLKEYVNADTINMLLDMLKEVLANVDDALLSAGYILDVDLVGLKNYTCEKEISTIGDFAAELAFILDNYAKGLVNLLFFGDDFRIAKKSDNTDTIVINGGEGYEKGLALILEALGCDAPKEDESTKKKEVTVYTILGCLADRAEEILADPVNEIIDLLPNLIYFLNANGASVAVNNLLNPVYAIIDKVNALGAFEPIVIEDLIKITLKDEEGNEKEIKLNLDSLTVEYILGVAEEATAIDLEAAKEILVNLCVGKIEKAKYGYRMTADRHDVITIILTTVLLLLKDEDNAEAVKALVGEEAYELIINLCTVRDIPVQDFSWMYTSEETGGNKVGETFSVTNSSELFEDHVYGPLYTEVEAQYIADNFGEFVDNILYLLGLEIAGVSADNLTDLINGLINGSLYNSNNVIAIRDALAGVLDKIANLEVEGVNVGKYIAGALAETGVANITAVAKVKVPEFDGEKYDTATARVMFVDSLCDVLEPLAGVLRWLLANEDLSFFVDTEGKDIVTLKGGQGYAQAIVPLLEVLGCENIPTAYCEVGEDGKAVYSGTYYDAVKNGDNDMLITSILNPLLDRLEVIVADPANEILSILPNVFYFINSNGVDTVVKNLLGPVSALLAAAAPVTGGFSIEATINDAVNSALGLENLGELNMDTLFEGVLGLIESATGYKFENISVDAIAELTIGELVEYKSANGKTAYKMVCEAGVSGGTAELVTVILRLIVKFVMHENNQEMLVGLLKDNLGMNADAEKYFRGVLKVIAECAVDTKIGMDTALAVLYYLFYGVDEAVGGAAGGVKDLNRLWKEAIADLKAENPMLAAMLEDVLEWEEFDDVLDYEEGLAPNGFVAFFLKIKAWFEKIVEWFRNLFKKDEAVETVVIN